MSFTQIGKHVSMSQLEAIVWDLDGTLVDTAPDLSTALNIVLDSEGITGLSVDTVRPLVGNGAKHLIELGFSVAGHHPDEPSLERLFDLFLQVYEDCATDNSRPFPGIVESLEQIREMGIPMGVCTNKPEALSRQILAGLDLSGFFISVIGGDTTPNRKPHPQPLLTCLRELSARPQHALMIGDSSVDVEAARAARIRVGVVPWGYRSEPVENLGADFILENPVDLTVLIRDSS